MRNQHPKQNQSFQPKNSRPVTRSARSISTKPQSTSSTSWGSVASWYDEYLQDTDTYQAKVIAPNLMRILGITDIKKNTKILELGCGQGYFLEHILKQVSSENLVELFGVDVSKELLDIAEKRISNKVSLVHTEAAQLPHIKNESMDSVYSVLALQNMNNVDLVIKEISRVLTDAGRCVFVINHPAFRIPKQSDWYVSDERKSQGRVVYTYMSEKKFAIDMHPGKSAEGKKTEETFSFHHPLQFYMKTFSKYGFAITRLEEWISHKVSEEGPKKHMEDTARKEIPLFMCLEIRRLG